MDQNICALVRNRWRDLHPDRAMPSQLVFMKLEGKLSANAAIIGAVFDGERQEPVAVAKIPRNPAFTAGVEREFAAMTEVGAALNGSRLAKHVPFKGMLEEIGGIKVLIQIFGRGQPMVREMVSRRRIEAFYGQLLPWLFEFHIHGAEPAEFDGRVIEHFVTEPVNRFLELYASPAAAMVPDRVMLYLQNLPARLAGRKFRLCRQHGDFNAHNLLVTSAGDNILDFTLIDWEDYGTRQLPVHDLNHFFISNSKLVEIAAPADSSFERHILENGWYRKLYESAVYSYEQRGVIDSSTFWMLAPLYLATMCLRVAEDQRQQTATAAVWIARADAFIDRFPLLPR